MGHHGFQYHGKSSLENAKQLEHHNGKSSSIDGSIVMGNRHLSWGYWGCNRDILWM